MTSFSKCYVTVLFVSDVPETYIVYEQEKQE